MKKSLVIKIILSVILCFGAISPVIFAQSGRNKPTETPTPKPRPRIIYTPSENILPTPTPTPKPTATPNKNETENDVIRVESTLVPIPVSVLDARGEAVTDLKLEDFLLMVDGEEAEISDLFRSDAPVRLALLFDNSSSVTIAREFEKKAAIRFFRRVIRPDKDLASLFSIATGVRLEQPLTKDVSQIIRAIESFPPPQGATALFDGVIKAANYLKDYSGRRIIVIVSDGDDTISDASLEETIRNLQLTNCQVYVVQTTDYENFKRTGKRSGSANLRQLAAERRMQEIAAQTGGAVYSPFDDDELDRAFAQISAELAQQYILSYYPEIDFNKRGQFRTISLSIKNRQDLSVRFRKSYFVPR